MERDYSILLQNIECDRRLANPDVSGHLPEFDESENALVNLNILNLLNGHRGSIIRRLAENSTGRIARYLRELSQWKYSDNTSDNNVATIVPANIVETLLHGALPEWNLYEQAAYECRGIESNADALRALTQLFDNEVSAWDDVARAMFESNQSAKTIEQIYNSVGCIPSPIFDTEYFANLRDKGPKVFAVLNSLKTLSVQRSDELGSIAQFERSRMLNALIYTGVAESWRERIGIENTITLDANGLFVRLRGYQAHIPYGLICPQTFEYLTSESWMSQSDLLEARIRNAKENSDVVRLNQLRTNQLEDFTRYVDLGVDGLLDMSMAHVAEKCLEHSLVIPDVLIEQYVRTGNGGVLQLCTLAQELASRLSQAIDSQIIVDITNLKSSHNIHNKAILAAMSTPEYYSVAKIAQTILENTPPNSDDSVLLVGAYRSINKDQYAFLEMCHRGSSARILVNETKYFRRQHSSSLALLPRYDRLSYEKIESSLFVLSEVVQNLDRLKRYIADSANNLLVESTEIAGLVSTLSHYILANCANHYTPQLVGMLERFRDRVVSRQIVEQFIGMADAILAQYYREFYSYMKISPQGIPERLATVHRIEQHYNRTEYESVAPLVADYGVSAQMYECGDIPPVRIVEVLPSDMHTGELVPDALIEDVLDQLRLPRNAPLIEIIGGARYMSGGHGDAACEFASAVMRVAHDVRANVAVPGTQSGIGEIFGIMNQNYVADFGHMPHRSKLHMFAVTPRGPVVYGPDYEVRNTDRNELYALTYADQLITPTQVDWSLEYRARGGAAEYRKHIAYTEGLFAKMSSRNHNMRIVGNGGYYSIMEIYEALAHGADVIILSDSGRLAEILALVMPLITDESIADYDSFEQFMLVALESNPIPAVEEFVRKDFGRPGGGLQDYEQLYRQDLFKLVTLMHARQSAVNVCTIAELEGALRSYFARE